jgi:hypothetical protein
MEQSGIVNGCFEAVRINAQRVLVSEAMKVPAPGHVAIVLTGPSSDEGRPGLHQDMAQLKTPRAISIVLKLCLGELERVR